MKYNVVIFSCFLLLSSFNSIVYAQSLKSLQIEFERYYKKKYKEEIIKGSIYFQTSENITVIVEEPLKQWMVLGKHEMDIYYPTEKKAFRFITQNRLLLPFFQTFVAVYKKDYGLMDTGYTLSYHKKRGDTLFTYWNPPEILSKVLGVFTLVYVSDKIVYGELKTSDGTIMSKSSYSNHIHYGTNFFPLKISTVRFTQSDSTIENITYTHPQFNIELPNEVINFKIPSDITVEEIEW